MKILETYKEIKSFEPKYKNWSEVQKINDQKAQAILPQKPVTEEALKEQERAKILVRALTSIDEYAQTKAEDVDSVSQTILYITVGTLGTIGSLVGKKISSFIKNQKISKALPSVFGVGLALATYLPFVRETVKNQVRSNRIARFEGMHDKLFTTNNFAVLTAEQKKEVKTNADKIPDNTINNGSSIIDRADIFNSLAVFKDLTLKQSAFEYLKDKHDKRHKEDLQKVKTLNFKDEEIEQSKKDKKLFQNILKNVDIKAHQDLEKIEKAINISYSSLFAGGVLEYLVSDGVLNLLKVKNKVIRPVLSWGLPILTIMSLNKQLANFLNDSVKAVRYKKMQEYVNDINNFKECSDEELKKAPTNSINNADEKPVGLFKFFKGALQDIKDYENYQNTKRIEEKKFDLAVRDIKLSPKQKREAELLKRNTELAINTLDDQTQKYARTMETITESTTIPLDITSPILGTFVADKIHKTFSPNSKHGLLVKALGAIVAFLPAAFSEIYFVHEQRNAKRSATLIAINNLEDSNKFLDPREKERQIKSAVESWNFNSNNKAFLAFKNQTLKQDLN